MSPEHAIRLPLPPPLLSVSLLPQHLSSIWRRAAAAAAAAAAAKEEEKKSRSEGRGKRNCGASVIPSRPGEKQVLHNKPLPLFQVRRKKYCFVFSFEDFFSAGWRKPAFQSRKPEEESGKGVPPPSPLPLTSCLSPSPSLSHTHTHDTNPDSIH